MKKKDAKAAERREEIKENLIALLIVAVLATAVGWWFWHTLHPPTTQDQARVQFNTGLSPVLGNSSAPVTVVEFTDFECSFCGEFARDQFPKIKKEFIDTGKIRFIFKHYPLTQIHPRAEAAAEAAACAQNQDQFWPYAEQLFAHQDKLGDADLLALATQLKLNKTMFQQCIATQSGQPAVLIDTEAGAKAGVTGTPTFFFNGRKVVGVITAEEFKENVEQEISS